MQRHDDIFYLGLKVVLYNRTNHILILQMQKKDEIFWELPGGRIQIGETEEQGLLRELKEEAGITSVSNLKHLDTFISQYRIAAHGTTAGLLFSLYVGYVQDSKLVLSNDHIDYAWVNKEEALKYLGDAYGPNLSKYL